MKKYDRYKMNIIQIQVCVMGSTLCKTLVYICLYIK